MKLLVVALVCIAFGAVVAVSEPKPCPPLCKMECPFEFAVDSNGCKKCECCEPYICHMLPCEHERDERGCHYCKCKDLWWEDLGSPTVGP
ncbi:hypothetical protein BsWGS_19427 [Bradybaena similaris]